LVSTSFSNPPHFLRWLGRLWIIQTQKTAKAYDLWLHHEVVGTHTQGIAATVTALQLFQLEVMVKLPRSPVRLSPSNCPPPMKCQHPPSAGTTMLSSLALGFDHRSGEFIDMSFVPPIVAVVLVPI
jgi:hypothetical protein